MERQTAYEAVPWRYVLDAHPPWAHWSFWVVWAITATVGPIAFVSWLLFGSGAWWIGAAICGLALVTMAVDWLVVRRLRRKSVAWHPWRPPPVAGLQVDVS